MWLDGWPQSQTCSDVKQRADVASATMGDPIRLFSEKSSLHTHTCFSTNYQPTNTIFMAIVAIDY